MAKTKQIKTGIPSFPKHIRDEILNYTDNKEHKSYIKLLDSPKMYKILMGAKNVSKSFGDMINTIWRLVNEPNFNSVWARNISRDIDRTISPNFKKALDFLATNYNIDYFDYFDIYKSVVVFKPTGQAIYFANFEIAQSFAGLTLSKQNFDFCEVVFDEIQQNPDELGDKNFSYEKQQKDMDFIIQSTVLRTKDKPNQHRHIIFTFNVYDSNHWVCNEYVKPIMPFSDENKQKIIKDTYLYAESDELNCVVMRMSRFYVPRDTISDTQLDYYEKLKLRDPKLYDITVAGEAYDLESTKNINPFKRFILADNNDIKPHLIYNKEINKDDFQMFMDGYDPGLKDSNGFCRIGLTNDFKIVVMFVQEISSKDFSNYKRSTILEYVLSLIVSLNNTIKCDSSMLAIDSKEDVIIELAVKHCLENSLNINVVKAIKNKNKDFPIDFSISNRVNFLKDCFEKQIISFTPNTITLLEYLTKVTFDESWKRNENINPKIYDLINAFEYALSIIYHLVIINHFEETR